MEVSNVSSSSTIGGITQPVISTRKVEHTIRLMDGETNLLGGILEIQDNTSTSGTPFLGQIPILKYLFSSTNHEHITNELVFIMVPHIVRSQELNDLNRRTFDVGTGSGIDLRMASKPAAAAAPAASTGAPQQPAGAAPVTPARQSANPSLGPAPPQQPAQQQGTPAVQQTLKPGQVGLRIEPGALQQQQGGTFSLAVVLSHGQNIASVPIQISYDPHVLQFVSVTNGDFLAQDGQNVVLVHRDDASAGKLQITAQRPPGAPGISGDGTVFNLTFTAKAKGTGTVSIAVPGARNSQNQPQDVVGSQTTITVN
jgi:general secretion pathway protein D